MPNNLPPGLHRGPAAPKERTPLAKFLNALRILHSLDRHELPQFAKQPSLWLTFRDAPHRYLMRCSDEHAAEIWAAIEARQPAYA